MKPHYTTLEIPESATPEEVKRAYRKKIKKAHPDQGGTDQEAAALNKAYAVLSSPDRRKKYDETGQDQSVESDGDKIRNILIGEFTEYLNAMKDENIIDVARNNIKAKIQNMRNGLKKGEQAKAYMLKKQDKIRVKSGVNLALILIEQNLIRISQELELVTQQIESFALALKELDRYESDEAMLQENEIDLMRQFGIHMQFQRNPWGM